MSMRRALKDLWRVLGGRFLKFSFGFGRKHCVEEFSSFLLWKKKGGFCGEGSRVEGDFVTTLETTSNG